LKRSKSLHVKTLSYLILFSITILAAIWIIQFVNLNYSYEQYQVNNMNEIADQINNLNGEDILIKLENIAYENEVCIEYNYNFAENYYINTKMLGCPLGKNNMELKTYQTEIRNSNKNMYAIKFVNNDYKAKAYLFGVKKTDGYIFIYNTLEDISGATDMMKTQLIYLIIIAIIFAIGIAYFLAKKITDPILKITSEARKLGSSVNKAIFKTSGITEIDELSKTLNNAQKEMSKTDELRRDLMANVSHDLKTPLTMIKAYAEMIRDISHKDDIKREEHLNIIIAESDRLNVLVNDLLSLSKLEADAESLVIEEFDLVAEVKEIIKRYSIIKETEEYNFLIEMPEKAIVNADKHKMNQVIYNLINNAINYTGKDKLVTIRITEEKKQYLVEIIDTGKGIKEEDIDHIWTKYYKNEKNHQRNVVGTGIGLSIVKEILEKHRVRYGVKSVKKQGSTFYFYVYKK